MKANVYGAFIVFRVFHAVSPFPTVSKFERVSKECHALRRRIAGRRQRPGERHGSPSTGSGRRSRRAKGSTALPRDPTGTGGGATPARLLRRSPPAGRGRKRNAPPAVSPAGRGSPFGSVYFFARTAGGASHFAKQAGGHSPHAASHSAHFVPTSSARRALSSSTFRARRSHLAASPATAPNRCR